MPPTTPLSTTYAMVTSADEQARAHKLQTAESFAVLGTPGSQTTSTDFGAMTHTPEATPLSLQLSLHRVRLALLVGLTTILLILLTLLMRRGTELERFDRRNVSLSEQEKLLDRYNSYSGTIASALGRPLEIFVSMMVQVVVLWLLTESVLKFTTSWRAKMAVLVLGPSVGFLLTNGLNALNVQVLELPVKTVMSMSDLRAQNQSNLTILSTVNATFSERTPKNPTANTIFRGVVLPRVAVSSTCFTRVESIANDAVIYGVPQQPWMKQLLPEAVAPVSTMKINLMTNADPTSVPDKLPINVSIAADLLLAAVNSRRAYSAFVMDLRAKVDYNTRRQKYLNDSSARSRVRSDYLSVPTTRLAGLLPLDESSTDEQDHAWFLDHYKDFIRNQTPTEWRNKSLVRWDMEMSRVELTPSMWVDAITFEREVIPMNIKNVRVNGSYYFYTGDLYGMSLIQRTFEPDTRGPDAQIHAFAVCADGEVDGMSTKFNLANNSIYNDGGFCLNASATSMYVFSSGRYFVADTYLGDIETKIDGRNLTNYSLPRVIKDLRVVYTSTFARVSWKFQNLSELYGAVCADTEGGCLGLDANLSGTDQKQRLLVGATALPMDQLDSILFNVDREIYQPQPLEIVSVRRPTRVKTRDDAELMSGDPSDQQSWLGDVLLRHNIRRITVDDSGETECEHAIDRRVGNYINNHIYIESTLQPTYTAAAFFLFQNGMVRDVLPQNAAASGGVALQLDQNVREMSVWLSTPKVNANLTLAGCVVLVAALCVMLVRSHFTTSEANERLKHLTVTTPHQIARVMLDDTTFPSLLLKRRVVLDGHEGDADQILIHALSVRPVEAENNANGAVTAV